MMSPPLRTWAQDETPAKEEPTGFFEAIGFGSSVRGSYWTSDRGLNDSIGFGTAVLWLRARPYFGDHWSLKLEGWLAAEDLTETRSESHGGVQELREAYLAYASDAFEIRAGRQIVVWGRADAINPTDNLSSRDFTLLFIDPDDNRRGNGMVQGRIPIGDSTLSVYWLPEFRPNEFASPELPPGIRFKDDEKPNEAGQGAVRFDRSGGAVDWSVSYFNGIDRNPDVAIDSAGPLEVVLQRRYHRIGTTGADFATVAGQFAFRGEAAYTTTEDEDGTDPEIKNSFFMAVLGIERSFLEYLNIIAQVYRREIQDFHDPNDIPDPGARTIAVQSALFSNQLTRDQTGGSLRIAYKWFHETLEGEILGVGNFDRGDGLTRVKISYAFTDSLKGILGGEKYDGPDDSFYGSLKQNSTVFAEIRYGY
jgi:hypothetical protein